MSLEFDLETTTVAAVKATVDAHLESLWRASGVRILRSDLPFCGIKLKYRSIPLATDEVLSSCKIRKGSTLHAEWPQKSQKEERRKRYGKERDKERASEKKTIGKGRGRPVEKKTLHGEAKKKASGLADDSTRSALDAGGDAGTSSGLVSGEPPDHNTEVEVGDHGDSGGYVIHSLSEQIAIAGHEQQHREERGQENRPTEEMEQDDPFADEDDNKENQAPVVFMPVVEYRVDDTRAEEGSLFDETYSGSGIDLMEEALEF